MNCYRLSKYFEQKEMDWTSFSDIGKTFMGKVLTYEKYEIVENKYLRCASDIAIISECKTIEIRDLEVYSRVEWTDHQRIDVAVLPMLLRDCLRDRCWCRMLGNNLIIWIGYDYYLYICSPLDEEQLKIVANQYNLYLEEKNNKE